MSAPGFTVSNPKIVRKNWLIGTFDLHFPSGLIVRGAMLFEKKGSDGQSRRWCMFPSKEWTTPDGEKKFLPILDFETRATSDRFWLQVMPIVENAFLAIGEAFDA